MKAGIDQGQLFGERWRDESERDFQSRIQRVLTRAGYLWCFVRRTRTPDGRWLTGTSLPGWPDLMAIRGPWLVAIEVKSRKGVVDPAQRTILERLAELPCARVWVLRPTDDREQIGRWIADPETAPATYGWVPQAA